MKKIGILTWYFAANYGARAQSYALQQTLINLGYDCYMIDYRPKYSKLIEFWYEKDKPFMELNRMIALDKANKLYKCTKRVKTPKEIDELGLDCVILGSDAIFNAKHPLFDPVYYGVGINTKKISFSPSCEDLDPKYKLNGYIKQSLLQLRCISVRDKNTKMLISSNVNREAQITLDPTLLYSFSEFKNSLNYSKYILFYAFSEWNEYGQIVKKYAKEHDLEIIAVGQKCKWADISILNCSFEQWLSAFFNAELVFTDSFHGVAFSIINQKQMILCKRGDKIAKIQSLLDDLGISTKFYSGESISEYLDTSIDYQIVTKLLEKKRKDSFAYLISSLEN